MMLLLLSEAAVAGNLNAPIDSKAPIYAVSILQNVDNESVNLQSLREMKHQPVKPTFSTLGLPSVFFLRVQILEKNGNEKIYFSITPSVSAAGLTIYSNELVDGDSKKSLIEGARFPNGDNFLELQIKEGIEKPVFFIKIRKKLTPLLSFKILNTSEFKSEKINQLFNTGLYVGVTSVLLGLILFFYIQYKKACLITLLASTILIFFGGIFREPHFIYTFFPLIQADDQIYYYSIYSLLHRSSLSLFLAYFLFDFSKNRYLKYFGAINFIFSFILLITFIFIDDVIYSGFSAINLSVNLLILMFCLTSELRKENNAKKLYLFVWPGIFIGVFLLALFFNLIPVPQDINFYELEWFRIYYTAIFIFILYTFYSSELDSKTMKIKESELFLISQVKLESELRQEQEELNKVVSHELKTPLTALYFLIDRLETSLAHKTDLIESTLLRMKISAQQINTVTDRFSWLSIFNTYEDTKVANGINILNVIKGIVEVTGQEERFRITHDDRVLIDTDIFYLTTILQNLIDNSLKYSLSNSEIKINLHTYDDNYLVFSISNLTPTNLTVDPVKIFDKYFRGTGSGGKPGLGIGLWLVKKIGIKIGISIDAIVDGKEIIFRLIIPNDLKNIK